MRKPLLLLTLSCSCVFNFLFSCFSIAHQSSPKGIQVFSWPNDQIRQVKTVFPFKPAAFETIGDRACMSAGQMVFDVEDSYAFNIDETVDISFDIDISHQQSEVLFQYDMNGVSKKEHSITLPKTSDTRWYRHTIHLNRARFAGRSLEGFSETGDFGIKLPGLALVSGGEFTVCNIELTRAYKSAETKGHGDLKLSVFDEIGRPTAARVGIYDSTGRIPLLNDQALKIPTLEDSRQEFVLAKDRISWPHENRRVFYIDETFHTQLPVGTYQVVVGRGIEYQFNTRTINIVADKETDLSINLSRFSNMPANGWYSGDPHIHASRSRKTDSKTLLAMAQAEDLHVANIMQMGTVGHSYYHQYAWGKMGQYGKDIFTLVPGQEDPRTTRMGHTLHLNLKAPVRNPERYYLYNEVFSAVHKQGGLSGYAHGGPKSMVLELPFGAIDFIEILQNGEVYTEQWFKALNLGFKLTPVSGSDYPYIDNLIGSVRTYVQTGKQYSPQAWFDGLKDGKLFVTNGPLLSLTVNGNGIGSELNIGRGGNLKIEASVHLNPEIDKLDKIELIQQGKVIAQVKAVNGEQVLELTHNVNAVKGSWFVIRATGKREQILAYSAPVYVEVTGNGWCDAQAVPGIVKGIKTQFKEMLDEPVEKESVSEPWDAREATLRVWPKNKAEVSKRVSKALEVYGELVKLAERGECI